MEKYPINMNCFSQWIGINAWSISGAVRELRLSGPAHLNGRLQEKAVLELQIPIST
jgi:hypothetical protein